MTNLAPSSIKVSSLVAVFRQLGMPVISAREQILDLWARGLSGDRVAKQVYRPNGQIYTESHVLHTVGAARKAGDPRAIFHRPPKSRSSVGG